MIWQSDPEREQRTETGITAFTWIHFIDHPDQPEWLIRICPGLRYTHLQNYNTSGLSVLCLKVL